MFKFSKPGTWQEELVTVHLWTISTSRTRLEASLWPSQGILHLLLCLAEMDKVLLSLQLGFGLGMKSSQSESRGQLRASGTISFGF